MFFTHISVLVQWNRNVDKTHHLDAVAILSERLKHCQYDLKSKPGKNISLLQNAPPKLNSAKHGFARILVSDCLFTKRGDWEMYKMPIVERYSPNVFSETSHVLHWFYCPFNKDRQQTYSSVCEGWIPERIVKRATGSDKWREVYIKSEVTVVLN